MVEDSTPRGITVTATQTYQNLTITLSKEGKDEQEEYEQCFFWIEVMLYEIRWTLLGFKDKLSCRY
ncbi:unnamed protein product [Nippostrongylus brasiliensis]|uniref:SHSP domain-containing protein n=1 Tax=Nippostrongylus brasiliensis TaxID=27835 RepID=A0A0N4XQB8_NIPBR|nr:unnamed protein product [Nippostrongylus brasiliensis]